MDFGELPFPTLADIDEPPNAEKLTASSLSVSAVSMTIDKNEGPISCELILIMDQCNIITEDLLNFRLVSKSWRDAATATLLKRDACHITFRKQRLQITSRENPTYKTYAMYNFRYNNTQKTLDDLTSLMSTSPHFPVSYFGIVGHRSRNNKFNRFHDHSELHRFLSLHGSQVKLLRLEKSVSMQELDLYSKYLKNLECIELDEAFLCKNKCDQNNSNNPDLNDAWSPFHSISTLRIIDLGRQKRINNTEIIKLLLNSAPQLKSIENFNIASLRVILESGKGHLIKEFNFNFNSEKYDYSTEKILRTMQNFSQVCSTSDWRSGLLKINLDVVGMEKESCIEIVDAINGIIRSCKDTLEELKITYVPEVVFKKLITIPQMKNLKYLSLTLTDFSGRDSDENAQTFQIETLPNPLDLEDDPSWLSLEAIFPKLLTVKLRLNDTRINNNSSTFLHFFKMPLSQNDATAHQIVERSFIPSVKVLETNFVCLNLTDAEAISAFFPNVKFLKNRLDAFYMFQNNLWAMCPLATSIEISGILWNTNYGDKFQVKFFDQFLTGFPFEICEKMRNFEKEAPSLDIVKQFDLLTFLKMMPSISDMPNLQKLTLKFEELSSQFGSQVSAVYALQKMPHVKFIASYNPVRINAGEGQNQNPVAVGDGYLASIAPYVQIVHEEQ